MADVIVREYLTGSPEPSSTDPMEYWSFKAAIWPIPLGDLISAVGKAVVIPKNSPLYLKAGNFRVEAVLWVPQTQRC